DAQAGSLGEADLVDAQFLLQEVDQLASLVAAGFEFDTSVDVFRVLAEDDHVGLLGFAHRRRNTLEVLNGAQADVEVKLLTQSHVQGTDTTTYGRGQRTLDGDDVVTHGVQSFFRQPYVRTVHLGGFFAGVDFHPVDLALATVCLRYSGIHHLEHDRGDINARAVAFNIRNDRLVRNVDREIGIDR